MRKNDKKKLIMLLFCLEIKLFITHKPGKWYCSEFAVSLLRRPNNPTYIFDLQELFAVSIQFIYLVSDEFVEIFDFWSQTLVSWQTWVQFETLLILFEPPEKSFFSAETSEKKETLCLWEITFDRDFKRSYLLFFLSFKFLYSESQKKKKKLYVCDKLNLNLNINTRTWLKIFISQFYYKSL